MYAIEYDDANRMRYNPRFHPNHGKQFTEEELEYLCAFYEHDGLKSISMALGRTEMTVATKYMHLKKRGLVEKYRRQYWERWRGELDD